MTVRTGEVAADVAWGRPGSIPADLILGYSGPAFPGVAWIQAWGKPFLLGYESTTTRAYAGGDAGAQDADQWVSVARSIPGYLEGRCGFWICCADANSTPAWALPNITEYARRFTVRVVAEVGVPVPGLGYGNPDASAAGAAGITAGGAFGMRWGVGTWGEGEGANPGRPPADSDAALIQSGNTPGPADGTDLDWLYQPLSTFAAFGGPASTPIPHPQEAFPMIVLVQNDGMFVKAGAYYTNGVDVLRPVESVSDYPQPYPVGNMTGHAADLLWHDCVTAEQRNAALDAFLKNPPTGGGTTPHLTGTVELHAA